MGPNPKSPEGGLKHEFKLSVMDGVTISNSASMRVAAGTKADDTIRKLAPLLGLLSKNMGELGEYYYGIGGRTAEGKPTAENEKNPNYRPIFPAGQADHRVGRTGDGIEFFVRINGKLYALRSMIGGEYYAPSLQNLEITGDIELVAAVNCFCAESSGGEKYLRYPQFEGNLQNPAIVAANRAIRSDELAFDLEISPKWFSPLPVSYQPARIGNEMPPIRWEAWAQFAIRIRTKPHHAPEDSRLTPELMRLVKELEAKNRRTKEMKEPSFAPMNFGFSFVGRRTEIMLEDEEVFAAEADKTPKRLVPVQDAQKETPLRKTAEQLGTKTSQTATTQSRMAETPGSTMWKINQTAQTLLQGTKTGMTTTEMPAGKHAEKEQVTAARGVEMPNDAQTMQKQGQTQAARVPMTFTPLSEGPLSFVQSIGESIGQPEPRTQMMVQQMAAQVSEVSAEAETAPSMSYRAGQTMTHVVQNQINAPAPVLPAHVHAQVVAAEPMKLAVEKENKKEKEKAGQKVALVVITAPVPAKKKKNAALVPARSYIKAGGKKMSAVMENQKNVSRKKAA